MSLSRSVEVGRLADQLERSFHGGAWHGPATREALAEVDVDAAGRRPSGSPHTIVEHVRHITFWLTASCLRIGDEGEVDPGADWPAEEVLTDEAWTRALAELEQAHAQIQTTLLALEDDRLGDAVSGTDTTVLGLLLGVLQHNAYHTGQIVQIARELAT